jgi:hypothetical protein
MILQDALIIGIKIIDIGFLTSMYFVLGMVVSAFFDNLYGPFNEDAEEAKTTFRLWGEVMLHLALVGIAVYILRNFVEKIPFPLDGFFGFEHQKVKELSGGIILTFSILNQSVLRRKIEILYNRLLLPQNRDPQFLYSGI